LPPHAAQPPLAAAKEYIMAIDFVVKDLIHKIIAKFIHAYLPEAKKPYLPTHLTNMHTISCGLRVHHK
jgi:hypothetical protein